MEIFNNPRSRRLFYLGFAIIVSVLYDFLVYRQAKGLGFVVFVAASLGGFILLVSVFRNLHSRWPLLFLVVIAVLTLDVFIYNNLFVTRVAPLVIYVLSLLIFILVPLRNAEKKSFNFRNVPLVRSIDLPFHNWGQILKDVFRSRVGRRSQIYKKIAYSLIIAFPLLLIFTFLFSQADSIFADGLGRAFNINWDVDATLVWRAFRIVAMSLYLGGIFYVLVGDDYKLRDGEKIPRRFDATVVEIVLSLINALFLVFVFIQIKYLFGSAEYVIANDLTYAEYARSGFFELVWVMIISALFLVATYRSFAHHGASKAVQFLKLVLIAQVLVIALSALRRMNVYQEAYGFTTLRLYVEWFIYASMFGFIVLAVAAVRNWQFRKFFYTILALGLIIFTIVSSVNVDRLIARKNIDRALSQGKPLDLNYLMGLSADAYPEIIEVLDKEVKMKYMTLENARSMLATEENYLRKRLSSWRQFNLGALRALNSLRERRVRYGYSSDHIPAPNSSARLDYIEPGGGTSSVKTATGTDKYGEYVVVGRLKDYSEYYKKMNGIKVRWYGGARRLNESASRKIMTSVEPGIFRRIEEWQKAVKQGVTGNQTADRQVHLYELGEVMEPEIIKGQTVYILFIPSDRNTFCDSNYAGYFVFYNTTEKQFIQIVQPLDPNRQCLGGGSFNPGTRWFSGVIKHEFEELRIPPVVEISELGSGNRLFYRKSVDKVNVWNVGEMSFHAAPWNRGGLIDIIRDKKTTSSVLTSKKSMQSKDFGKLYFYGNCYSLVLPDGSWQQYELLPYFFQSATNTINNLLVREIHFYDSINWINPDIHKKDEYGNTYMIAGDAGSWMRNYFIPCTNIVNGKSWFNRSALISIGRAQKGDQIYEMRNREDNPYYAEIYQRYKGDYSNLTGEELLLRDAGYSAFINDQPIIFWEDPFGNWRVYIKTRYRFVQ